MTWQGKSNKCFSIDKIKKREREERFGKEREKRAKGDKEGMIKVFIQSNEIDS